MTLNKYIIIMGLLGFGALAGCRTNAEKTPIAAANSPADTKTANAEELPIAKFREEADGLKNKIGGRNVVVYFEKANCQACTDMRPIVARAAQNNGISVMRIIPTREEVISFGIGNYPTTVLFMGGQERQRWLGQYHEERFAREFNNKAR